jgi:HNH endonuclease
VDDRTRALAVERFLFKVNKDGPRPEHRPELGPCWLWKPLGSVGGYGAFYLGGRGMTSHRASYILFVEPIPDGLVIDHLCRVRNCVRPEHLEAVTSGENTRRGKAWESGAEWQRSKTTCPKGHEYAGDNLRISPDGSRSCRTCGRAATAASRARRLAKNPPPPKPVREFCGRGHSFAEFGVLRGGMRICGECSRDRTRQYRERRRAEQEPKVKTTCKQGHPWAEDNIYTDPRGHKHCKACHNERTLARYYAGKAERPPRPAREACGNGHPWNEENVYVLPDGTEKCRPCARARSRRYTEKIKAATPPRQPRTHCKHGHELAGDNLYVAPDGREFCRACAARRSTESQQRRRDGVTPAAPNPAKGWRRDIERCPAGHEYDEANTYVPPSGGRKCRECIRVRTREFQRAKRAAAKTGASAAAPDVALTLF